MASLLFIHGTGVRQEALASTMSTLQEKAAEYLPGWRVEPCAWGDPFGAALNHHGASIPSYQRSVNPAASAQAQTRARWVLLADDPLIELRVSPKENAVGNPPEALRPLVLELRDVSKLPDDLQLFLRDTQLVDTWSQLIDDLAADTEWTVVLGLTQMSAAAASPLLARALAAALAAWLRERNLPELGSQRRDQLAGLLLSPLGGPPGDIKDWFLARATAYARRHRGSLTDLTSPAIGDILRYQARGETVRKFIGIEVERTGARVLLAHSLGTIAAVDWLAEEARPIDALITFGTQVAYFYEIDALASRVIGSGLPAHFPQRWLNFYDENDMLSYPAAGIFKGKVHDICVDNGEPFPESHSAYVQNRDQVWPAVADFLRGV